MHQLSHEARERLDAYKLDVLPDAQEDAANWSAIERRVTAGEADRDEAGPRAPVLWIGVAVVTLVAAAALVFLPNWSGLTAGLLADDRPSEAEYDVVPQTSEGTAVKQSTEVAPKSVSKSTSTSKSTAKSTATATSTSVPEATPEPEPEPAVVVETPKPKRAPKHQPTSVSQLNEETSLLRQAHAAIRSLAPARALSLLAQHKRRFPRGAMAHEREVLKASALCDLGKADKARAQAKRFVRRHPRSPLAAQARRICVD